MGEPADNVLQFQRVRPFRSIPFEEIQPSTSSYILKGVLPARGTAFIVGQSKAGKTFITIDWALRLAAGAPSIMGRKAKQVGVAYIAAEDPEGVKTRIEAWRHKWPRGSYTPFRLITQAPNLLDEESIEELQGELDDIAADFEAQGHKLGLIVFDTFSRCIPGAEENSSERMSLAVGSLDKIGRDSDALALVVAHHGKAGDAKGIRGWSGLDAASDATVTVERDEVTPEIRKITFSKVKNGQDGDVVTFGLERQNIGLVDEDGDEIWSCVVRYDGAPAATGAKTPRRKALSASAEIVLTQLGRLIDRGVCQDPPVMVDGVRPGTKAVRRSDLSLECATSGLQYDGETPAAYRQRFGRAINELQAAKRIRVEGDAIWPC